MVVRGGVQTPARQVFAPPQAMPSARLPVSAQAAMPAEQLVIPVLHGFAGWHSIPAAQAVHAPARQTWFVPQPVPSAAGVPRSVQPAAPVPQICEPRWHGFAGTQTVEQTPQVVPLHGTQDPPLQTSLGAHGVPSTRLAPVSLQTAPAPLHVVTPMWQALDGLQVPPPTQ